MGDVWSVEWPVSHRTITLPELVPPRGTEGAGVVPGCGEWRWGEVCAVGAEGDVLGWKGEESAAQEPQWEKEGDCFKLPPRGWSGMRNPLQLCLSQ